LVKFLGHAHVFGPGLALVWRDTLKRSFGLDSNPGSED